MRRTLTRALIGGGVSLALLAEGPAAAAEPYVSAPRVVKEDRSFTIIISNCKSSTDPQDREYTAEIIEKVTRPDGTTSGERVRAPDESDGVTEYSTALARAGRWKLAYTCRHSWPGGSTPYWEETIHIDVEEAGSSPTLTKKERKKCKKKATRKARKRCLRRQRND